MRQAIQSNAFRSHPDVMLSGIRVALAKLFIVSCVPSVIGLSVGFWEESLVSTAVSVSFIMFSFENDRRKRHYASLPDTNSMTWTSIQMARTSFRKALEISWLMSILR